MCGSGLISPRSPGGRRDSATAPMDAGHSQGPGATAERRELFDGQEEVYLLLRGSADLHLPGRVVALEPDTFVRVGPLTRRRLRSGEDGAHVPMIGGIPGRAYEPLETRRSGADTLPCPTASTSGSRVARRPSCP
jgi:hypothetical protein